MVFSHRTSQQLTRPSDLALWTRRTARISPLGSPGLMFRCGDAVSSLRRGRTRFIVRLTGSGSRCRPGILITRGAGVVIVIVRPTAAHRICISRAYTQSPRPTFVNETRKTERWRCGGCGGQDYALRHKLVSVVGFFDVAIDQ